MLKLSLPLLALGLIASAAALPQPQTQDSSTDSQSTNVLPFGPPVSGRISHTSNASSALLSTSVYAATIDYMLSVAYLDDPTTSLNSSLFGETQIMLATSPTPGQNVSRNDLLALLYYALNTSSADTSQSGGQSGFVAGEYILTDSSVEAQRLTLTYSQRQLAASTLASTGATSGKRSLNSIIASALEPDAKLPLSKRDDEALPPSPLENYTEQWQPPQWSAAQPSSDRAFYLGLAALIVYVGQQDNKSQILTKDDLQALTAALKTVGSGWTVADEGGPLGETLDWSGILDFAARAERLGTAKNPKSGLVLVLDWVKEGDEGAEAGDKGAEWKLAYSGSD